MRNKLITASILTLATMATIPSTGFAHHGVNGQFDLSKELEKTGTVTRVRFVNPHSYVYFDVKDDAGNVENWRCELRSGSLLRRKGWKKDYFSKGTVLKIVGSPARKEPTTCYTKKITFEDGRELVRYGEFNKDGSIKPLEKEAKGPKAKGPKASTEAAVTAPVVQAKETVSTAAKAPDLTGVWGEPVANGRPVAYGVGRPPAYELTQAAKDVANNWTMDDNPRVNCKATNIIHDYRFDQMLNKFEQTDEMLTITYGFMDIVRKIHINGKFPETIEPSVAGYSVGTWKDNKLVVETKGFTEGFLSPPGGRSNKSVRNSDQMEITEVFYIDEKNELIREYSITDPVYLAKPHAHLHKAVKSDHAFEKFACDDLTVEEGFTKK